MTLLKGQIEVSGTPDKWAAYDDDGKLIPVSETYFTGQKGFGYTKTLAEGNPAPAQYNLHEYLIEVDPTENSPDRNQNNVYHQLNYNSEFGINQLIDTYKAYSTQKGTITYGSVDYVNVSLGNGVDAGGADSFRSYENSIVINAGYEITNYAAFRTNLTSNATALLHSFEGFGLFTTIEGVMANQYFLINNGANFTSTSSLQDYFALNAIPGFHGTVSGGVYGLNFNPTAQSDGNVNNITNNYFNPQIDSTVPNVTGLQFYGYGTSAPTTFSGMNVGPNFTGDGVDFFGVNINPNYNTTNSINGFRFFHGSPHTGKNITAFDAVIGGDYSDGVTGININLDNATHPLGIRKTAINSSGGTANIYNILDSAVNTVNTADAIHNFGGTFQVSNGSPITGGAFVFGNLFAYNMLFEDDMPADFTGLGLGFSPVAYVGQISVKAGKTVDSINMTLSGIGLPTVAGDGGTVTDFNMFHALGILPEGGNLNVTNMYAFRAGGALSAVSPTNLWGISIEDGNAENYFEKSIVIGGGTKKVSNSDVGIEIASTKALLNSNMTTTERDALTALSGMQIYNETTTQFEYYNGTNWTNSNGWSLNGNSGTVDGVNFIGNIDSKPINFKIGSALVGRIEPYDFGGSLYGNTFWGTNAGEINSTGQKNVAIGSAALSVNTTGNSNISIGDQSMFGNSSGYENIGIGVLSLYANNGNDNVAIGREAIGSGIGNTSSFNTGIGTQSLLSQTTGNHNIALGYYSGFGVTTGSHNVFIGTIDYSVPLSATLNNTIVISDGAGNIRMWVDSSGKLGVGTTTPGATLEVAGTIKTVQPSGNGAGVWKLGKNATGVALALDVGNYIEVDIDGAIVKLARVL